MLTCCNYSTFCAQTQIEKRCACRGLHVDFILNTHHHFDHTGGLLQHPFQLPTD